VSNLEIGYHGDTGQWVQTYLKQGTTILYKTEGVYGRGRAGGQSKTGQLAEWHYGAGQTLSVIRYRYDANGNMVSIENGSTIQYQYDALNQLIRENNPVIGQTICYRYDAGRNLLEKQEYAYTTADDPGTLVDSISYTYGDSNWKDKLTAYDGSAITTDAIGNPTEYINGLSMTWTKGRQLATVGSTTAYAYNDQGIRIKKTIGTTETKYHLVGDRVTAETTGIQTQYYTYSATGELVGIRWDGDSYYYIKNAQGDIIQIVDDDGSVVVAYTYDTWGKLVSITGSAATTLGVANPYRYRSYRYDNETGFYYLNSRYYDPVTSRYLNADNYDTLLTSPNELTDKNLFGYCDNNPVMRLDSYGEFWFLIGAAGGAVIGGAVSAISQYATTGSVNLNVVRVNAAAGAIAGALASTGVGLVASVGINAALGGVTYAAEQAVQGKEIASGGLIISTIAGGIGGAIGGTGVSAKGLNTAWKSAQKGVTRELRRANVKYATMRIVKYSAEKVAVKNIAIVGAARFTAGVITYTGVRLKYGY